MKLRVGNMFDHLEECDVLLVTTNSYIKKDGSLVMGRGAALEIQNYFNDVPQNLGKLILGNWQYIYTEGTYGLVFYVDSHVNIEIGAFQVKHHFRHRADLSLIQESTDQLKVVSESSPQETFFLNYPGIGNGGLTREEVEPIVSELPNNVHVWIKE